MMPDRQLSRKDYLLSGTELIHPNLQTRLRHPVATSAFRRWKETRSTGLLDIAISKSINFCQAELNLPYNPMDLCFRCRSTKP